jgi:Tol biopolymer transport system component
VGRPAHAWVTTELVSHTVDGAPGNNSSWGPAVSDDGRFVVFVSYADELVTGDGNDFADVFLLDRETGGIERMSLASDGSEGTNHSGFSLAISPDARFVAFESLAPNLVAGDGYGRADVFVRDRVAGTLERVSIGAPGVERDSREPAISPPAHRTPMRR